MALNVTDKTSDNEKEERFITHYTSSQRILLVGEGDFSFSLCLARAFGSANNMVATSLDSQATLLKNYKLAEVHLQKLKELNCLVLHEIDVKTMHEHDVLKDMKFDRIIYNFPHAAAAVEATYSASVVDSATISCFFDPHPIVLMPNRKRSPEVLLRSDRDPPQSVCPGRLQNSFISQLLPRFPLPRPLPRLNCLPRPLPSPQGLLLPTPFPKRAAAGAPFGVPLAAMSSDTRFVGVICWNSGQTMLPPHIAHHHLQPSPVMPTFSCDKSHLNMYINNRRHMELVGAFFKVASKMLNEEGQVHVSHRDDYPYRLWRIEDLANDAELVLKQKEVFSKWDYPGYSNKRGSGVLSDNEFPLIDSFTFKFSLESSIFTDSAYSDDEDIIDDHDWEWELAKILENMYK
ncbi:uncharacterized protein LOC120255613 [Dioscorea cayenensis subsp. rotundata]|uniref:Uncharacterized protein LOC120255613 n=1 Tax=Dioscorea cayennensis subsp. rotundata TaxID=55577 RepID=A0AB40AWI3_DIOCR|nr:uncharacterized protein LOC120255613 [Dioscorea cayenensis subsp. rotundata]